jgi:hypothetical protein
MYIRTNIIHTRLLQGIASGKLTGSSTECRFQWPVNLLEQVLLLVHNKGHAFTMQLNTAEKETTMAVSFSHQNQNAIKQLSGHRP